MAMVTMNNFLNGKDSRWLQLEVCREFQRNKCSRPNTECKFAHPAANVEVQNGLVTACYDSVKVNYLARVFSNHFFSKYIFGY
uniref:Protein muscleblind-like isoform X1 n=1 Tax=Diabrotica virgifera virgifera TaxID=50390 RepID=A0A6P7F330_DIAVI